jgi:hypothetical protein
VRDALNTLIWIVSAGLGLYILAGTIGFILVLWLVLRGER